MATLLEPPPRLSVVPAAETAATVELTVAEMMVKAIALYESANNDLLDAGRLLASVQALGKKKFPKLMVEKGLEKTQAAKLIKMAEVADFIPSVMAGRLGIHMLIQLGQKRNEAALDAITDDDTQLSVAQKMKTLRAPAAPKENKPVRFIGNQKGGVGKLRIEVPGGPEAVEIERDWRESGLPPHQWLKSRIDPFSLPYNPTLHNEVPLLMDVIEPSATETLAAIVTPQPETALPSPATEQSTVYEVATAELHEYLEAQSQSIAPEPQQEVSTRFSSLTPPTERYMLGWNLCDQVIANSVVPTFEQWFQGKPVLIESVQGSISEIQQLIVTRHDGESRMSFGNWVEEIKSENTTPTEANTVGLSNLPVEVDYALLSDALKKAANWQEVEQLVERDSSRLTFAVKEWTPVQKNGLKDLLTGYLESDADALRKHQVDWMPLVSLEKSFKQLFFKVRNIMEGLTAPWLNGFAFVHVDDFGLDTEKWTFIDPASSENIKVYDRKDFAVQAS